MNQEIKQLQEEILTLKLEQPYHPDIKAKILKLEELINAKSEPSGQA